MEPLYEHKIYGVKPELFSKDFVAGLIVGEGTFYWTKYRSIKLPCFALKMHIRDFDLLLNIKYSLELDEKIHEYKHGGRHYSFLIVRKFESLRKIINDIYPKLGGYKKEQFVVWFKGFKEDNIREDARTIYNIFRPKFPELYI